uniref:Frenatin-4 n=1 Tax=Nyctimystes infrafrenatus TaxID=61195 RepID=FRE4_NYCIN|nr:RecName: Full=Frenatin-4 [Nyctimystes infrafrenatus]prf//2208400D frenatin:ISOTYPE=4 [Nyctimystes infrafrenatus]
GFLDKLKKGASDFANALVNSIKGT